MAGRVPHGCRSLPQFCGRGNLPLSLPSEQALTSEGLRSISRKHAESTALNVRKSKHMQSGHPVVSQPSHCF